jgi:ATP-dependent helicase/nuclease subunit A
LSALVSPIADALTARARAEREQKTASDPAVSAFVAASAGSGKTKVLTDRLLRLMLRDDEHPVDPGRIQCLTFTKAAAAEMALRLQKRLGEWVTLDDTALDADLRKLPVEPTPARRLAARALFARVLDLPGGMRIGTIHAFCEALLRRFPLEARLSPHFQLIEEGDAALAMQAAREDMLAGAHTPQRRAALEALAGLVSLGDFGRLVEHLQTDRKRLADVLGLPADLRAEALDRAAGANRALGLAEAVQWNDRALREAAATAAREASATVAARAQSIVEWLAQPAEIRAQTWTEWSALFLKKDGKPYEPTTLVNKKLAERRPDLLGPYQAEQQRILAIDDNLRAIAVADITAALLLLAAPVLESYVRRKDWAGQLDFDDLIVRTSGLLVDPGAAWVLYKLDGGIDHLLLDEVQDTAPAQWEIAGALTAEFFSGEGAAPAGRTVFAVGDRKQSIYSFQGADPDAFEHWRGVLSRRATDARQTWRDVDLDVSFRSTAPVLALVDAVFAEAQAAAGVASPGTLRHFADRAGHAGRVELWPLVPAPERAAPEPWQVPDRNLGETSAMQRLADSLATWIGRQTDGTTMLHSRGRPLRAGDVLVLVRRRNEFARALVRALKVKGVPVAGIDRMVLTDQPAVADLLALCDALLLPQDDLAFACMLTSPIGGLTDDDLMRLAMRRTGTLWEALRPHQGRDTDFGRAADRFARLLARVDYASPHALLVEALGPLGGRARLLARLGPEAAEPVDELLQAALADARAHPPSLQGFLHRLRGAGSEVKREAEGAGDLVRVMTVHGAKGLQAPLVILPDTTALPPDDGPLSWTSDEETGLEVPVWSPRKELRCAAATRLRQLAAGRRAEEQNRLLYVALTRAEDRLVVCGWQTRRAVPPTCWYEQVKAGFARLPTEAEPVPLDDGWPGEVLIHACAQTRPPEAARAQAAAHQAAALPAWAGSAPDWRPLPLTPEPALPQPLAPSRPLEAEHGPVPPAASPLAARGDREKRFARGKLVHTLLQHLPNLKPAERDAATLRWLHRPGHGLTEAEISALAAEVGAVLAHPDLAALFGPEGRSEVPLTGVVGNAVVGGLVDRIAVLPDRVLIADYKTNRLPPKTVADVPVLYLRQLAAYRAVLRAVFPGRPVACALVWTAGPLVMRLPDSVLDDYAPAGHAPHA